MSNKLKWFFIPLVISVVLFVVMIINFSGIIDNYPLNQAHIDFSSHMARIHFLDLYGFEEVPNWYNGFYPFASYYFGYYMFTLPIFLLFSNMQIAVFISVLLIYSLIFISFLVFSKTKNGLGSKRNSIIFFIMFILNPLFLFDTLNLGRLPEFFGWLFFILNCIVIFHYKDRKIDSKFISLYSITALLLIFSGTMIYFLSLFLLAGLFLINKNKIKIAIAGIIPLLLSMPWWINIILSGNRSELEGFFGINYLKIEFFSNSILTLKNWYHDLVVIGFLVFIFLYYRKQLLFWLPTILLAILYLFKITYFLPLLKIMYNLIFVYFFWFLLLYLLIKIDFSAMKNKFKILALFFIHHIHIPFLLYFLLFANYASFDNSDFENEVIELSNEVDERFVVVMHETLVPSTRFSIVSYITSRNNVTTPMGWVDHNAKKEILDLNTNIIKSVQEQNCLDAQKLFTEQKIDLLITFKDYCSDMIVCGFELVSTKGEGCIMEFNP